jgi:hypothetical protein
MCFFNPQQQLVRVHCNEMDECQRKWLYGGALLILIVSGITLLFATPSVFRPTPFYLLISAWLFSYFALLVMPICYAVEFWLVQRSSRNTMTVLVLVVVFGMLNFADIYMSWDDGVKVHGYRYTGIILFLNVITFSIMYILAISAYAKNSKKLLYAVNLILFVLLSWSAFPYLGELP